MKSRNISQKIPDIRAVRFLTKVLGQLGVNTCRIRLPSPPQPYTYSVNYQEWSYGLGLIESKKYVERLCQYQIHAVDGVVNRHLRTIQYGNIIEEIKASRRLMQILYKLSISSANAGLGPSRMFVKNMRNLSSK